MKHKFGLYRDIIYPILAKDDIHARKIASDLFAKYKAEKEGL